MVPYRHQPSPTMGVYTHPGILQLCCKGVKIQGVSSIKRNYAQKTYSTNS